MTAIRAGKSSKALTATRFVTKKVFENQGVNHWSNFSGPTPKTKVAPNPIFPKNMFGHFFEKTCSEKISFGKYFWKNIFSKKHFSSKMIFLSPGTVKISIASKNWCLRNNFKIHISHGDPNHKHFVEKSLNFSMYVTTKNMCFSISRATLYRFVHLQNDFFFTF